MRGGKPAKAGEAAARGTHRAGASRGAHLARTTRGALRRGAKAPARPGSPPRVGVLSLQGDFALHSAALRDVGAEPVRVSLPEHLAGLEALVLPGGETSTMLRLLDSTGLRAPIERFARERPVLGTCAGLLLLARDADHLPRPTLGVLDISARRNAWGRQVHSFTAGVSLDEPCGEVAGVFIRAPRITRVGRGVQVIARLGEEAVGVRQGSVAALAFHPELTPDRRLHAWFLRDVAGLAVAASR